MLKYVLKTIVFSVFCIFFINTNIQAQVNIVSANFTSYNVSPGSLSDIQVMNPGTKELQVVVESKLFNSNNEILLQVKTNPIALKLGLNSILSSNPSYSYVNYTSNKYSQYIQNTKTLPSGKYRFCTTVMAVNTSEPQSDDYCDELEAEGNNLLYLISVPDKEEIETEYPVLVWYHSEPFNLLAPNEFYRMVLVEMNKDQSPDAAITVNQPLYVKNFLTTHSIQYPIDAKKLEPSKHYAWQVQKMSNGAIIDKTEAWEFSLKSNPTLTSQKYVYLKENLDASSYQCIDGHVYFAYKENYSGKNLSIRLYNDKHKQVEIVPVVSENVGETKNDVKSFGSNYCDLNLEASHLKSGIYFMEVSDDKGEVRKLKIKFEK